MSITETYDLQDDQATWADSLQHAVKHFFTANGRLPNCIALDDALLDLFPKALEPKGFKIEYLGIHPDILDKAEQKEVFEHLFNIRVTVLVSPEDDYRLVCTFSDEMGKMQFQLFRRIDLEQSVD
jgi:hypothetical protein